MIDNRVLAHLQGKDFKHTPKIEQKDALGWKLPRTPSTSTPTEILSNTKSIVIFSWKNSTTQLQEDRLA